MVTTTTIQQALQRFMDATGTNHNGGDCAIVAKSIAEYLESKGVKKSEYEFAGELFTDRGMTGIVHVFVKYKGNYYDAVEGKMNVKGRNIVDGLEDDGSSIGNDKYGWIDYYNEKIVKDSLKILKGVKK